MKVSVSMWSFVRYFQQGKMDTLQFVEHASKLEVAGVELLDFFWKNKAEEMPAVKERLAQLRLPVSAYAVGNNFVLESPEERAAQVDVIKRGVDDALFLGTKRVRVFAGDVRDGVTMDKAFYWICGGLEAAARYAERNGVILCLENHGRLAGRGDQIRAIIDEVGSDALRANVDTGNFLLVNQPPHEAVREVAALTSSVHLKDFKKAPEGYEGVAYAALNGDKYYGTVIGEGDVGLLRVLTILKGAGYKGYLAIEFEGETDPAEGVAKSVQNARDILARIGS